MCCHLDIDTENTHRWFSKREGSVAGAAAVYEKICIAFSSVWPLQRYSRYRMYQRAHVGHLGVLLPMVHISIKHRR